MQLDSRTRVRRAMECGTRRGDSAPDRVPVFCQLSIGHYFLHGGVAPFDIWYRSEGFAEALVRLAGRYRFDGILVNLPGRPPDIDRFVDRIEPGADEDIVHWQNGCHSRLPHDDCAHYFLPTGERYFPTFDEVDPATLYYVEPWDVSEMHHPTGLPFAHTWGFEETPRTAEDFFPDHHLDTLRRVIELKGAELSVHSEVFSPFSQLLELFNYEKALMALLDDPSRVHACLERLTLGAADLASRQAACGVDAVLISSAFAGAGLIGRDHYGEFVLPYERRLVEAIRARHPETFVYTHTCGSIGDRLDLMLETGTQGIDTLDPPPLGTVELESARELLDGKAFIKGNIDPVTTMLNGGLEDVRRDARRRIEIGSPGGGYILSTACSVAPATPPQNLEALVEVAEES